MMNVRVASATNYVLHNTTKCSSCHLLWISIPLIYFCFDNVYARVESALVSKLSARHHKYGRRNATM